MRKYHSPLRWSAGTFVGCMAFFTGYGVNAAHDDQSREVEKLRIANVVVIDRSGNVEEANRNFVRVEHSIGEYCLASLRVYMPGGALNLTPEDSVVSDLTNRPDKPCGNTQTDARAAFRRLDGALKIIGHAESERTAALEGVKIAEAEVDDPNMPEYVANWSLAGIVGGSVGAWMVGMALDSRNRYRGLSKND